MADSSCCGGNPRRWPQIETRRLLLRPIAWRDLDAFVRLFADADVMRYLPTGEPRSPEETRVEVAYVVRHWQEHGFGSWAVTLKDGGDWAGYCLQQYLHEEPGGVTAEALAGGNEVEIGYGLAKTYWGRGIAFEAAQAALRHGFQTLQLPRVVAAIHPDNAASRRILEKLGLKPQSEMCYYGDCPHFAILREEFVVGDEPYMVRSQG